MGVNEVLKIIFGLFGGLAIFIFGMNMMSECLQSSSATTVMAIGFVSAGL